MKNLLLEIKRFLKKYIKNIFFVSILLTIVFTGMYLLSYDNSSAENEETVNVYDPALHDGNAYFQFYVEDENQQPFTNTVLFNQYIRLKENLENVSNETKTNLLEAFEEQETSLLIDPLETVPVIEIRRDGSSHLLTFYARLESEEDNMRIANYMYDQVANNQIPFLEDKEIYLFLEPTIFNDPVDTRAQDAFSTLNIVDTAIIVVILFILSFVLAVVINIGRELFSKKLNFSFTYSTDEATDFNLYSTELGNQHEIAKFLSAPGYKDKLLITQSKLPNLEEIVEQKSENKLIVDTTNLHVYNQIENMKTFEKISEIIIVIVAGETDREWFNEQKRISSLYSKPVKFLQINR